VRRAAIPFSIFMILTLLGPGMSASSTATFPGKGLAGLATTTQLDEMGATWFHDWRLCKPAWDARCINVVKGSSSMTKADTIQKIAAALETCQGGWFMFGDEWQLQGWTMDRQVAELFWFLQVRDLVNPACAVAFGGELIYVPNRPDIGPAWVHSFWKAYRDEYGKQPDVQAVVVDAYDFSLYGQQDYVASVQAMVDAIHQEAGSVPVWGREVGSLVSHRAALDSVPKLRQLTSMLDRMAFFITYYTPAWAFTGLYDQEGMITDLGLAYREMPATCSQQFLPLVRR
jgi:hypothetical protein